MTKKVFVSGCYDMLHSGHVAFFEEAATHGDLYVGLGSDKTINQLKARKTINTDQERLYMVKALKSVKDAWINVGSGLMDFEKELRELRPDIFFVNEDGYTPDKQNLCKELGIELMVSRRLPHRGLPARSTTVLRNECLIPFRLDLAGGWLDRRLSPSPSSRPSISTTAAACRAVPVPRPSNSGKRISPKVTKKNSRTPFSAWRTLRVRNV